MRVLLLAPFLPDRAATHGGGAYLSSLVTALAKTVEVGLVSLVTPAEELRAKADGNVWHRAAFAPYLGTSPSGIRQVPHQVRMLWHWRRLPLVAAKHWNASLPAMLAHTIQEWQPDVAMIELAQMSQYLPYLRGLPTVLTDHEAGCPANTRTGLGGWGDRRDRRLWDQFVRHYYPMADLVQAVTPEDAASLRAQIGRDVVVRAPVCDVPATPTAPKNAPPRALFFGDYRHHPNPEAATRLVREVLPRLRASLPTAELWLAGQHCDRIAALAATPGVRVLGFVPDLPTLFQQVRLLLAPVWSGGGFRMKSLVALAHGLPVVTNALGARGCAVPAVARSIAEDAAGLAAAALAWLQDADAAAIAGLAAHKWALSNLSATAVAAAQIAQLRALKQRGR